MFCSFRSKLPWWNKVFYVSLLLGQSVSQEINQTDSKSVRFYFSQSVCQSISRSISQTDRQSVSESANQAFSHPAKSIWLKSVYLSGCLFVCPSVVQLLVSHLVLDVSELIISISSLIFLVLDGCSPPLRGMGPTAWWRGLGTTADRGQASHVLTVPSTSSEECGPTGNGKWRVKSSDLSKKVRYENENREKK